MIEGSCVTVLGGNMARLQGRHTVIERIQIGLTYGGALVRPDSYNTQRTAPDSLCRPLTAYLNQLGAEPLCTSKHFVQLPSVEPLPLPYLPHGCQRHSARFIWQVRQFDVGSYV